MLELRCWQLREPLTLRNSAELWGCFSWVLLPADAASDSDGGGTGGCGGGGSLDALLDGATAAVADEDFARWQAALRAALVGLQGVQELEISN